MAENDIEDPKPRPGSEELTSLNGTKPRQWIIDRSNGESKTLQEELGRPFCPMCWPPPCVKWAPDVLEQNACCEGFGNIGVFPEDHSCSRIWLMRKSLLVHFAGAVMSGLACLAIANNVDLLRTFSFSSGRVTGIVGGTDIQEVIMEVGLTAIYIKDYYFGERTMELNELCTGKTLGIPLTTQEDCQTCYDASTGLVITVIMGVVTYLPTIASNVNRAYYNYDVNCQKVFGTLVAFFSMLMSLYTWHGYAQKCFGSFFDGDVTLPVLAPKDADLDAGNYNPANYPFLQYFDPSIFSNRTFDELERNPITIEEAFPGANATVLATTQILIAKVNFDWKPGVGLILVVVATFLKMIDIINHFLIRTPSITRDVREQLEYEQKYGAKGEPTEDGAADAKAEEAAESPAQ